jgi:hypothetical protein
MGATRSDLAGWQSLYQLCHVHGSKVVGRFGQTLGA